MFDDSVAAATSLLFVVPSSLTGIELVLMFISELDAQTQIHKNEGKKRNETKQNVFK